MSKAEERALEKYPLLADDDKEGLEALKYIGMECDCASEYNQVQESKQAYFIKGYHQAEKDLELTWKDIREIYSIILNVQGETSDDYLLTLSIPERIENEHREYKETLKRYFEWKKQ